VFLSIGLVFGTLLAEIPFMILQHTTRAPQHILLTIPAGAADLVARGEQPPSLPQNMNFVVGDTLVVRNQDSVQHQLGPLFIPPGASASLLLDRQQNYAFQCSFVPTKYFGLNLSAPLDIPTRLYGIVFGGIPMGILLAIYSIVAWPVRKAAGA
jgi:hypothetical protein